MMSAWKLWSTVAVAAAFVAAGAFGFWRLAAAVRQKDSARNEILTKIEQAEEERLRSRTFSLVLGRRRADAERISAFFVERSRPVDFIEAAERTARSVGARLAIDVDETGGDGRNLKFRFTLEGGREGLARYVRLLELLPYKIEIREMTFQDLAAGSPSAPQSGAALGPDARLILLLGVRTK